MFKLVENSFFALMLRIEDGYSDNPYHNRIHAACVLHMMHLLLHNGPIQQGVMDGVSMLACYLSGEGSKIRLNDCPVIANLAPSLQVIDLAAAMCNLGLAFLQTFHFTWACPAFKLGASTFMPAALNTPKVLWQPYVCI